MIVSQFISTEADLAVERYGAVLSAFQLSYARALNQPHFGSPKQLAEIAAGAYAIASFYLQSEGGFIEIASTAVALEAQRVTLEQLSAASVITLSEAISEHANESDAHLSREITIQVERDIAMLTHTLRKTILSVGMAARAAQIAPRQALMQHRVSASNELSFVFLDRSASKWPSLRFLRSLWRQHLLAIYNETVLLTLSDHGIEQAEVQHTDEKAPVHGMIISIVEDPELPSYSDILSDVFHPNSEAILRKTAA